MNYKRVARQEIKSCLAVLLLINSRMPHAPFFLYNFDGYVKE